MMLLIGAGAVGTTLATYLMRAGRVPLRLYAREKDRGAFESALQLCVEPSLPGRPAATSARPALTSSLNLDGVRYVILCVKFSALESLIGELGPLPADCTLVSTLNGVRALQVLRQHYPDTNIVPMSVMFNGQLLGPLHAQITTHPLVVMGTSDPVLLGAFQNSGMKVQRADGDAAVWGKLLINLANAVCALTHTTFKDLFTQMPLRRLYTGVLDEAIASLSKAGIAFRLPMPIPYPLFRMMLLHGGPLPWWIAHYKNGVQQGSYPSMVSDVEQGRVTEVAQLNGEIVRLGRQHQVATPINQAIVDLIEARLGQKTPAPIPATELVTLLLPANLRG